MSKTTVSILGGDYRYKYLFELLKSDGFQVKAFDNPYISDCSSYWDILRDTELVIAPIPLSKDGEKLFLNSYNITILEFLNSLKSADVNNIICGVVTHSISNYCKDLGINIYDFFYYEEVAIKNAIPTAEGAIMTAIEESHRTLFGSDVLVMGYGRCGKILANTLKGIGARVSATYRNEKDRAYIEAFGINAIELKSLNENINKYSFIFNTIPALVLDKEILKKIAADTIIIDISQAPGGVDYSYAKKLNLKALYCPGIPGRTAPYTAAEILKNIVVSIAMEL